MPMYNLIVYSNAYLKTPVSLCQYYGVEPTLDTNNNTNDFLADKNNSISFKCKHQITGQTGNASTNDVETMVLLKYLSNFWRTVEMPLISCEISLQLKWSKIIF